MFTSAVLPWRSRNLSSPASDATGFCWQTFYVIKQNQSATSLSVGLFLSLLLSPHLQAFSFTIPIFYHPVLLFSCNSCWEREWEERETVSEIQALPTQRSGRLNLSLYSLSHAHAHTHTHTVSVSCLHCVGWAEHSCHTVTVSLPPHYLSLSLSLPLFLSFPFPLSLLFSPSLLFLTHIRSKYTH